MNRNQWREVAARWQYPLLLLVVLSMLAGFFSRSVEFHDEMINLGKAQEWLVFDYALRPVFYGVNALAAHFLGPDPFSLALTAFLLFAGLAFLTFEYVRRDLGGVAGLASVVALAWSGLVYYLGIRGMPHLYPSFFIMAAIFVLGPNVQLGWGRRLLVALLLWMALLSHPTALALVVGFFSMFLVQYLLSQVRLTMKGVLGEVSRWAALMLALWAVTEVFFFFFTTEHRLYVSYLMHALDKTSSSTFKRYGKPYPFYFERVGTIALPLLTILGAISLTKIALYFWTPKASAQHERPLVVRAIALSLGALVSLLVVSLEQWKFDRVLVTFLPWALLALTYSIFVIARSIGRRRLVASVICALLITGFGWHSFVEQVSASKQRSEQRYEIYSANFDVIRRLDTDVVGYLGLPSHLRVASVPVTAAGGDVSSITLSNGAVANSSSLAGELIHQGHRYVILDVAGDAKVVAQFHALAYSSGFRRLADISSREAYELWDIAPASLGVATEASLDALTRREHVATLLDPEDRWVSWSLKGQLFNTDQLQAQALISGEKLRNMPVFFISKQLSDGDIHDRLLSLGYKLVTEIGYVAGQPATVELWERRG